MNHVPAVGDRFELPEEGIHGVVSSIENDEDGEPAALVIECDDGKWAAVPLDAIEYVPPTVH